MFPNPLLIMYIKPCLKNVLITDCWKYSISSSCTVLFNQPWAASLSHFPTHSLSYYCMLLGQSTTFYYIRRYWSSFLGKKTEKNKIENLWLRSLLELCFSLRWMIVFLNNTTTFINFITTYGVLKPCFIIYCTLCS